MKFTPGEIKNGLGECEELIKVRQSPEEVQAGVGAEVRIGFQSSCRKLRHAGRNPTRASVLRAATHLNERNPFMRKGIVLHTSPSDYFPIAQVQRLRYVKTRWVAFGRLVPVR